MPSSGVYTVSGLVMLVFLASRAACGGGVTEGPCPCVGTLPVGTADAADDDEIVAR